MIGGGPTIIAALICACAFPVFGQPPWVIHRHGPESVQDQEWRVLPGLAQRECELLRSRDAKGCPNTRFRLWSRFDRPAGDPIDGSRWTSEARADRAAGAVADLMGGAVRVTPEEVTKRYVPQTAKGYFLEKCVGRSRTVDLWLMHAPLPCLACLLRVLTQRSHDRHRPPQARTMQAAAVHVTLW
jgi:hypothetical protein